MTQATYELLDFGIGERLEQWGPFRLIRPDPTALSSKLYPDLWESADAVYSGEKGKGSWVKRTEIPDAWTMEFDDILLRAALTPYKHTGIFPEQHKNWLFARETGKRMGTSMNVLHLFAYTGGATVSLAKDGHTVTHVDSSKPAITWAKQNAELNQLPPNLIRWMPEDAGTFVSRELKRGKQYDAIILDPPAYGHGTSSGTTWRVERDLAPLLEDCVQLLTQAPAFLLLNGYAQGDSPESFHRLLTGIIKTKAPHFEFRIEAEELLLKTKEGSALSTGIVARCMFR